MAVCGRQIYQAALGNEIDNMAVFKLESFNIMPGLKKPHRQGL